VGSVVWTEDWGVYLTAMLQQCLLGHPGPGTPHVTGVRHLTINPAVHADSVSSGVGMGMYCCHGNGLMFVVQISLKKYKNTLITINSPSDRKVLSKLFIRL